MATCANRELSSSGLNLLDLPIDMIYEILLKLDLDSIENIGRTCKNMEECVAQFKKVHKEYIARKTAEKKVRILVAGDEDDYDDHNDWVDDDRPSSSDDIDDIQRLMDDVYDGVSWGSNYDEEVEEFFNLQ